MCLYNYVSYNFDYSVSRLVYHDTFWYRVSKKYHARDDSGIVTFGFVIYLGIVSVVQHHFGLLRTTVSVCVCANVMNVVRL